MQRSETIANLAAALCKAQSQIKPAIKDSVNPFFKSKYADFGAVLDACEDALADNGLSIIQAPISDEHGAGVETMLLHSSGEFLSERLILPAVKDDPQGLGSCITYARRYALEGFMRIKREDDDGNAAVQSLSQKREAAKGNEEQRKKDFDTGMAILKTAVPKGVESLALAWSALSEKQRQACKEQKEVLKAEAMKTARGEKVQA